MGHNLNPFDFVPFALEPLNLKTIDEWLELGDLQTGYLELQIRAITPVHIIGEQKTTNNGNKILQNHFFRRHNKTIIPAATIRGMLRSFIEASCNCWASQITPFYLEEPGRRKFGFQAINAPEELEKAKGTNKVDHTLPFFSLPEKFNPQENEKREIDLATFLFGYTSNKGYGWNGPLRIEDVLIKNTSWGDSSNKFQIPDIEGTAFMGGPNPSARTWWYHNPFGIRKRRETITVHGAQRTINVLDFLGNGFRGRKFYYHQDPTRCIPEYHPSDWQSLYHFDIECQPVGTQSEIFRISFEEIPFKLLKLLIWALSPHSLMRHKIGYGKSYGYGSISINIVNYHFRKPTLPNSKVIESKTFDEILNIEWNRSALENQGLKELIHWGSIEKLYQILFYQEPLSLTFTYPKFNRQGFLPIVSGRDLEDVLREKRIQKQFINNLLKLEPNEAELIAESLSKKGIKPALHFEIYKRNAIGYNSVTKRMFS